MSWIRGTWKSFLYALNGLRTVAHEERNFKIEILSAIAVVFFGWYCGLTLIGWVCVIIVIGFVMSAEIVNTVVEDLCNKIEPNIDPDIKKIKDMMAAYVFVVVCVAAIVGVLIASISVS